MKIVTFGCRINTYESALIQQTLGEMPGLIIVNTCAVTAEAERQCRQTIRRLKKENPSHRIIVTGCAAQLHPEVYAAMPEVDRVLGNREKLDKASLLAADPMMVGDIEHTPFSIPVVTDFDGRTRAFIQVQQGCDHACTFCVVHAVRGHNKGVPVEQVLCQMRTLMTKGYQEFVVTGIDVTSYPDGFSALIERILTELPDIRRLRLGSLDPKGVDDHLIDLFGRYPALLGHMHLSVQAGDNLILKRMGRRHTREDVLALVQKLRAVRPDMVFGADLIAGFPTETPEQFEQTMALVREAELTLLHVFPFSVRPGTPSAKMPMVPVADRKKRAEQLRALGKARLATYLKEQVGQMDTVLIEEDGQGFNTHYIKTKLTTTAAPGTIVRVRNKGTEGDELVAET